MPSPYYLQKKCQLRVYLDTPQDSDKFRPQGRKN